MNAEIDAPWLADDGGSLIVNGVDGKLIEQVVRFCKALKTLSLPFVLIGVVSHPLNGSPVFISVAFRPATESEGS